MKFISQSIILALSFGFVFLWQLVLSDYTIPLLGLFIVLYLILSARKKGMFFAEGMAEGWSIFILNTIIFLLVFSTGSINSILFFLLYFLGFGIAFIFEPAVVFVFAMGTLAVFFPDLIKDDVFSNAVKLGSLALISPLAYFFGREYKQEQEEEQELTSLKKDAKEAADTISKDVSEIIDDSKTHMKGENLEKLNEILEKTETLRKS